MINIREPYYTAGKQYEWKYNAIGLGISLAKLQGEGKIQVMVGSNKKVFEIDKVLARSIIDECKSYYDAKGTRLGVLPWEVFDIVQEEKEVKIKVIKDEKQTKLF